MSLLQAKDLRKRYGDAVALEALHLPVDIGQGDCLLGANGTGRVRAR